VEQARRTTTRFLEEFTIEDILFHGHFRRMVGECDISIEYYFFPEFFLTKNIPSGEHLNIQQFTVCQLRGRQIRKWMRRLRGFPS
jgi:hypothetical protein